MRSDYILGISVNQTDTHKEERWQKAGRLCLNRSYAIQVKKIRNIFVWQKPIAIL